MKKIIKKWIIVTMVTRKGKPLVSEEDPDVAKQH